MEQFKAAYFDDFSCLAGDCPDTCCELWEIDVEPELRAAYDRIPGELGQRLRAALRENEDGSAVLVLRDGRCALLDCDGLCAAQKALGPPGIGRVCREFPRMVQDYGSFAEYDLELSCPEAARLILTTPRLPPRVETVPGGEPGDYDEALMELLRTSREAALTLVSQETRPLGEALAAVYLYACEIQARIDGAEPRAFDPDAAVQTARSLAKPGELQPLFDFYRSLELLTPDWEQLLQAPGIPRWTPELRAFARYELNRYWLHAVSDFDLVPRVKMVLCAVVLLCAMEGDPVRNAMLYSKEIDDDSENIDTILDSVYAVPAFTDDRLLGHLLRYCE